MRKINFNICCVLLITVTSGFSQSDSILDNFTVFENNGKVYLNWIIKSGRTCNGTQIFRSTDSLQFLKIGSIAGVCGSSTEPVPYNFTDDNPITNSVNYYRLELGSYGTSHVLSVEIIDIANDGYQIRPNPASTKTRIYFDNNSKQLHHFSLFNVNGFYCTSLISKDDYLDFDVSNLQNGIYFFTILNSENILKAKGKLNVVH